MVRAGVTEPSGPTEAGFPVSELGPAGLLNKTDTDVLAFGAAARHVPIGARLEGAGSRSRIQVDARQ
jgi:hypothetical protein